MRTCTNLGKQVATLYQNVASQGHFIAVCLLIFLDIFGSVGDPWQDLARLFETGLLYVFMIYDGLCRQTSDKNHAISEVQVGAAEKVQASCTGALTIPGQASAV